MSVQDIEQPAINSRTKTVGFVTKVVVVRALPGLGDFLLGIPALRALKKHLPYAHMSFIGLPSVKDLADRFPNYIDEFIEFKGWPGIPEVQPLEAKQISSFISKIQDREFDLALQFQGSGITSNSFTLLLGAKITSGFFLPGQWRPNKEYFIEYNSKDHESLRLMNLVSLLGFSSDNVDLEFPVSDLEIKQADQILDQLSIGDSPFVCLHPGANSEIRRWPLSNFASVGNFLTSLGYKVILTGNKSEVFLTKELSQLIPAPVVDLGGKTSLGVLAAILSRSKALISNDTGIAHLGAALHIPSITIFQGSDPSRWAPLNKALNRSLAKIDSFDDGSIESIPKIRCLQNDCVYLQKRNLVSSSKSVEPGEVIILLEEVLKG